MSRCKFIDFVGQPQFVVNGLESITISWNSSRSMNFTVQTWNNGTSSWEDTRCNTSIAEGICLVDNPRATVINLRPSSLYFFKVTARDKITSSASKRMKTKELGDLMFVRLESFIVQLSCIYHALLSFALNEEFLERRILCIILN